MEKMSNLIDRQAAIDAIDDWWITVDDNRHPVDVIKALPPAQSEPQWISVTERLPEKQERVLTVDKYGSICVSEWLPYVDDDLYGWMSDIHELENDIIAWMPLPEPFREDDIDYEHAVDQLEHDIRWESTFNPDAGSM